MPDTFDWRALVGAVAPTLATALGGPLAGAAVSAIGQQLLGKADAPQADVIQALQAGGPDALLKLKQAEQDFQQKMRELDIDVDKLHQADRASARDREARTGDTLTPRLLALLVTLGFFGVLAWMLENGKPIMGGDALLVMLGALGGAWGSVVAYYFGSSAGSSQKTELLARR